MNPKTVDLPNCDVVMKGGITSGIVYPKAIRKLAGEYQFKNIGGTSAGAIAACLTAAAEYARQSGRGVFDQVGDVPQWLGSDSAFGGGSNLFRLFQPQAGVKGLYRFATAFLMPGWLKPLAVGIRALWIEVLLGLLPVAVLLHLEAHNPDGSLLLVWFLRIFVFFAGIIGFSIAGLCIRLCEIPKRHFGFCTGYAKPESGQPETMVGWLCEKLNQLAGLSGAEPLTFGHLEQKGITLRLMTTCLTFGRPYTLPLKSREFYYKPDELKAFFPASIMTWLANHPGPAAAHADPVDSNGFVRLPETPDMPVIVAARMSLSFPLLFCAVPLYAVDWTRRRRAPGEAAPAQEVPGDSIGFKEMRKPECVWFSDGGICSNFPIHLFDNPLPGWPTFGINLADVRPDRPAVHTWIPNSNRSGIAHLWARLNTRFGLGGAGGFIAAMFNAARNWTDNLQTMAPGYRDRVVTVYLDKKEGGLNLNMPQPIITALSGYGDEAAGKLIDHFKHGIDNGQPTEMNWDNHRWIRYRSTIALIDTLLHAFAQSVPGFYPLIRRSTTEPPPSYRFDATQRAYADRLTQELEKIGAEARCVLDEGSPKPTPSLEIRPKL